MQTRISCADWWRNTIRSRDSFELCTSIQNRLPSRYAGGYRHGESPESAVLVQGGPDSATEAFLRHKAIEIELRDLCRTYLAVSDDMRILGFVSVGIKCLSVPERNQLSGKVLKSMNIEAGSGVAQSYLLGQLSRSEDSPKGLGRELLDVAFEKLDSAKRLVGCRMVRLDCHDELIPYYQAHGFRLITRNAEGTLNQMMAFVQSRNAEQEVPSS